MKIVENAYHFFDRLEDHVRALLSTHKFIYTFIGGVGIVLFWRGVWHMADALEITTRSGSVIFSPLGSIILSIILLLVTGLFVSVFIGDSIIMSGIKREKKDIDKSIDEMEGEKGDIDKVMTLLKDIKRDIEALETKVSA